MNLLPPCPRAGHVRHLHARPLARRLTGVALLLGGVATAAQAGRPLATDDAAAAEAGACQVEAWQDRSRDAREIVLAPACGLAGGVELGMELSRVRPASDIGGAGTASLKWAPAWARMETSAGELAFGLKLAADFERPTGSSVRQAGSSALVLATLRLAPELALHANAGLGQVRPSAAAAASTWLGRAAVAWTPTPDWLAFAEVLGNGRAAAFGGTVLSAGARRWVIPERVGLDLTLARERGGPRVVGVGLGWYGIGL